MLLAGVDEVGRGPLAGPVVAAAVMLDPARPITGLADSKQLPPQRRARLDACIRSMALACTIGTASVAEIDRLNIRVATLLAMRRALLALRGARSRDGAPLHPGLIMIDGNCAPQLDDCFADCRIQTVVRGDALIPAISAASILAKTWRDALMVALDRRYPGYGLARHCGYGTRAHLEALARLGPLPIHRRSFDPLRSWLAATGPTGRLPPGSPLRDAARQLPSR